MDNKEIEERVWNVVAGLTVSREIMEKIVHAEDPVAFLSSSGSFYKELYLLKAALSIPKKWWSILTPTFISFLLNRL